MKKNSKILLVLLFVLFVYTVYWFMEPVGATARRGTIQYLNESSAQWGLEVQDYFLGIPAGKSRYAISFSDTIGLADDFKIDALPVIVSYGRDEQLGIYDWQTYITITDIKKIK